MTKAIRVMVTDAKPILKDDAISFWEAEYGVYTPNFKFEGDMETDVAIIGGGFTGLTVAREFKLDNPGAGAVVLEGKYVGFGASGRNGGFNMSLFGLEPEVTVFRWGKERTKTAFDYMAKAVAYVRTLVADNNIECDYEHNGMLRVAYSASQVKRLAGTMELLSGLDCTGRHYQYLEKPQLEKIVNTDRFQAAIFEPESGILNPTKHVRALKILAENAGAKIYENSPVINITRAGNKILLKTENGTLRCEKLVIAVNAWSAQISGLPRIRSRQTPVWTAQVVTQPLSKEIWDEIGWLGRESIEDNRQMVHYFRRTACGRISIGGGNVARPKEPEMAKLECKEIWNSLEKRLKWMFPVLDDIAFDYRWGGPVSVNADMTPEIGHIGDERIIYANGCIGHGVSLTQLNGRLIADLLHGRNSDLTDFWMVNRKAIPWPQGLIGVAGVNVIKSALNFVDRLEEKNLNI